MSNRYRNEVDMLTVDAVMSTVRSLISCGSRVSPTDELLQSHFKRCEHAMSVCASISMHALAHLGLERIYSLSCESMILSTSFSATLSFFLAFVFCLVPAGE